MVLLIFHLSDSNDILVNLKVLKLYALRSVTIKKKVDGNKKFFCSHRRKQMEVKRSLFKSRAFII